MEGVPWFILAGPRGGRFGRTDAGGPSRRVRFGPKGGAKSFGSFEVRAKTFLLLLNEGVGIRLFGHYLLVSQSQRHSLLTFER